MILVVLIVAIFLLLGLNAFFVLAEFAIVKVRPSRVTELVASGNRRAKVLAVIKHHLDEYLGVCQVGITLASVALGMVGEQAAASVLGPGEQVAWRYAVSISISYILVSGAHIVLAELVPKSIAIRLADRASLWIARPLRVFRALFYPVLWFLNSISNLFLRLIGIPPASDVEHHSEEELRIILDDSQEQGLLSFRRLLFMENVFDLGTLVVRDTMRPRTQVVCLKAGSPWIENLNIAKKARFTRYPLIDSDPERPVGFVHLKDVLIHASDCTPNLKEIVRPMVKTTENARLEALLVDMQQKHIHTALVFDDAGEWTGIVTLEDIVEEVVGTIRDEFEDEEPVRLSDALTLERIHLGIEAANPKEALRIALERMPRESLPLPVDEIVNATEKRGRTSAIFMKKSIGVLSSRIAEIQNPFLMILRSEQGIFW